MEKQYWHFSPRQEIWNSITHGLGALLSIAAFVILIVTAVRNGTAWHVVSFTIFGSTLVILYMASTLYHALVPHGAKNVFERLDHSGIFLLIAGTYTPFLLTNMRGVWGWTLFGIIWGLAIAGIIFKSIYLNKYRRLSVAVYVMMGWLFVIALQPMLQNVPGISLRYLLIGGIFYTSGVLFYARRKWFYHHAVWHLFVLAGSIFHFFSVMRSF